MARRNRSSRLDQTTMLAMPVSSSMVQNTTLPLPGRWRTSTTPATESRVPSASTAAWAQLSTPSPLNSVRRKRIGCDFSDRPAVW